MNFISARGDYRFSLAFTVQVSLEQRRLGKANMLQTVTVIFFRTFDGLNTLFISIVILRIFWHLCLLHFHVKHR